LNRLQEELNCLQEEPLPRLNAQSEDSFFDPTICPQEEDFTTTQETALLAEENDVQFIEGKNFLLAGTKLFIIPFDGRRLWTQSDLYRQADLLETFIECAANCPGLLHFRDGVAFHLKHAIGTNLINFASVGHIAGCLNLEDEVQNGDVPVDS
jgi:hypothetical protein